MNLLKTALTYVALFCVGAATPVACSEPELGNPSFRCDPAEAAMNGDNGCPGTETCCSDDPATVGGKLPNYYKDGVSDATYGAPLFSDNNNALSTQGMCVATAGIPSPLVNGCPVPCNPTWTAGQMANVCANGTTCCQTQELDPNKDCIMGEDGRWRTVTGEDILADRSSWGPNHSTNQDPNAAGCTIFSQGNQDSLRDCIRQLSVADQRGFCYSNACPCVEDVCALKNGDTPPRCTAAVPGV